ncbi:MAG: TatD family hydrolase [Muribaculaceae bacterium]|nr:TatD family hydrolase [Muribaculaceae bacterium]
MLVDTHTHLYLEEFEGRGADAVRRALDVGVGHMVFPNVDLSTVKPMQLLHEEFPSVTSMAMGLHPTEVNEGWRDDMARIKDMLVSAPQDYVAVGEIGMDLYWDSTFREQQMQVLDMQLGLAREYSLPVIIHCREGLDPLLEVLQDYGDLRGVMHSFGGTADDVDRIRKYVDFYFGINGIVTFKNSKLRDALPAIDTSRLVLETDSPYLAPVPHRGKRNESAFLPHTAAYVAAAMNMPLSDIEDVTTRNAATLFRLTV